MKNNLVVWGIIIYIYNYIYRGSYYPVIIRIIINHYKDPYELTSIMESKRVFSWLR